MLKELAGPHVLLAFAAGAGVAWSWTTIPVAARGFPVPTGSPIPWLDEGHVLQRIAPIALLGLTAAAAAFLAKRLTGNTLVSACAGAMLALLPRHRVALPWTPFVRIEEIAVSSLGLFAAGVRLLSQPGLRLIGVREILAIAALLLGSVFGPAIAPMPLLILLADVAYAPVRTTVALRRGLVLFPLHAAAVVPSFFVLIPEARFHDARLVLEWPSVAMIAVAVIVVLLRDKFRQKIVLAAAFAIAWAGIALLPVAIDPQRFPFPGQLLAGFGAALLVPVILWRISVAATQPRIIVPPEAPLPSVPALRDLVQAIPAEAPAARQQAARTEGGALGVASMVETAVASAVAATLEQIRLAFRGRQHGDPPGTPEQVLWNRLITGSSGGALPAEKPAQAVARWREIHARHLEEHLPAPADVLCAGATPWPLVAVLAGDQRSVTVVERGGRSARLAMADLAAVQNVRFVRHDGRRLDAIANASADAIVVLFEASRELPAENWGFMRECARVLRKGGVAGIGFADLALPECQAAITRPNPAELFTTRDTMESVARLAGLRVRAVSAGVLPTISVAWLEHAA
jgi:hypothetical protein